MKAIGLQRKLRLLQDGVEVVWVFADVEVDIEHVIASWNSGERKREAFHSAPAFRRAARALTTEIMSRSYFWRTVG